MRIEKVGLLQGYTSEKMDPAVAGAAKRLKEAGCRVLTDLDAEKEKRPARRDEVIRCSDVLVVCGGDGSILSVARCAAKYGVPVLGVNFGQLGFLSEVEAEGLSEAIDRLLEGRYTIEKRLMLRAQWNGQEVTALNDIVVRREYSLSVVRGDVHVDGMLLDHYVADGILVSTPTGASAYALSCGGPIVHPQLECLSVMAICPHSLRARPVMLGPDQVISAEIAQRSLPAMICADGQDILSMATNEPVVISRAPFDAQLIRLSDRNYFSMVHDKLVGRIDAV